MSRIIRFKAVGAMIFLLLLSVEAILISQLRSHAGQKVITMGDVAITVREPEYERREQKEKETEERITVESVKPGEDILRDPTIYVGENSERAYLRIQVVVKGLTEYQKRDLLEQLAFAEGWNYNPEDGYFYYRKSVTGGEQILCFDRIHIPEQWEGIGEIPYFQISVVAEAVQSSFLTPNIGRDCQMLGWIPADEEQYICAKE